MLKIIAAIHSDNKPFPVMIGKLEIINVSGHDTVDERADYKVEAWTCDERHSSERLNQQTFIVTGYDRSQGFWALVHTALGELNKRLPPIEF